MSVDGSSVPPPFLRINVAPASAAERPLLEGLFQFYVYDFAEFATPELTAFEFDEAGRLAAYPHMDTYWNNADRWPLLIRVDGRTAGFALVNTQSHCGEPIDRNMGEFFVARRYRRHANRVGGGSLDLRDASRTVGGCRSSAESSGKIVLAESYRPCTERSRNPSGGTERRTLAGSDLALPCRCRLKKPNNRFRPFGLV